MERSEQLAELLRNWKPPAELSGSLPRPVRLSSRGTVLAIAMAINLAIGGFAAVFVTMQSARETRVQEQLQREGVPIDAVITRLWVSSDKSHTHKVSYQFPYQGLFYPGESSAPRDVWRELRAGTRLPVRFLPSSPAVSQPTPWKNPPTPVWLAPFVGLFLAAVAALIGVPLVKQRRLLAEGRTAPAIVTGYRKGKSCRLLDGEFALPGGAVIPIRGGQVRTYPEIGSTICVLYDREDPRRNAPYPLPFVDAANAAAFRTPRRL